MEKFLEACGKRVAGVISGWDRIRFRGTVRWLASERGLNTYMGTTGLLLKDFGKWAERVTASVRAACEAQAQQLDIPLIYLRSAAVDKEAMARKIACERGVEHGDICMFSVLEPCESPLVAGNRATKRLELRMAPRKCAWIYQYWNDPQVGFGHSRLQTWLPLTATICLNGRHWLERQLDAERRTYVKSGNCFPFIANLPRAQQLLDAQLTTDWPTLLQGLLDHSCPAIRQVFGKQPLDYYWSADETEWASDIMFRNAADLKAMMPFLLRHGMLCAQSPAVMRFLSGRPDDACIRGRVPDEVISDLRKRHEGVRLKHWVNRNSVKMYNKAGNLLRVETTINATRVYQVFRRANDDPQRPQSWQHLRKGVADLHRRAEVSQACNNRYADHLSHAAATSTPLAETVRDVCKPVRSGTRRYRGLNLLREDDLKLMRFIARGEHTLNGFRNRDLRAWMDPEAHFADAASARRASGRATRRIQLLRAHGLVRKVPRTTRYQLTAKGSRTAAAILAASEYAFSRFDRISLFDTPG
jgi:hypothetical protein